MKILIFFEINLLKARGVQRQPGDAKCVTEILGDKIRKLRRDKVYLFVSREKSVDVSV